MTSSTSQLMLMPMQIAFPGYPYSLHQISNLTRRCIRMFNVSQISALPITCQDIQRASCTDRLLSQIYNYVKKGWPRNVNEELKPYFLKNKNEGKCLSLMGNSCHNTHKIAIKNFAKPSCKSSRNLSNESYSSKLFLVEWIGSFA